MLAFIVNVEASNKPYVMRIIVLIYVTTKFIIFNLHYFNILTNSLGLMLISSKIIFD